MHPSIEENKKSESQNNNTNNQSSKDTSSNGIQIGLHTLGYGRYVSDLDSVNIEIVLNKGGTCTYKGVALDTGSGNYDATCTYSAKRLDLYGYGNLSDTIEIVLADGKRAPFQVTSNNAFSSDLIGLSLR